MIALDTNILARYLLNDSPGPGRHRGETTARERAMHRTHYRVS